jgi:hypothetical protein
VNLFEFET